MFGFIDWLGIAWVVILVGQYFDHRRRLAAKDRRIEALEHLLAEYRDRPAEVIDVDDVKQLLPDPGEDRERTSGVDLKIDL